MKYNTVTVREICSSITSGGTPSSTVENYYVPAQIPWLKTKEVNYSRIYETENYISRDGLEHSSAKLIPENSVIVAMYGQGDTAGRVAINKIPLTTNQACCNLVVDAKKADYNYVYYALSGMYEKLVSLKNGGAQPNLNAKIIGNIKIELPDITVQRRIADILSAYDDLIENNRKQIKLLEEAAQRLYKEWFLDLRFPGWETTGIVDGVPVGWMRLSIGQLGEYLNGFAFKPTDWEAEGKPIIKIKEMTSGITGDTPRNNGERVPDKYLVKAGDILFSWSATLCAIIWNDEDGWLNQHLFKVTPHDGIAREFVLQSIKSKLEEFSNLTTGSTMKHIQRGKLDKVFVLLPNNDIMSSYAEAADSIRERILALSQQIKMAQEARERLLPKLMSGELEV